MTAKFSFLSRMPVKGGIVCLLSVGLVLSACDRRRKDVVSFDGLYFNSRAVRVSKEEREHFTVEVRKANQSLAGAREAGRHSGISYCIKQYGTSTIDWVVGPDEETLIPVDDQIRLEGYCRP
ncbi:hypothetical protein [Pseudopelagicola sp. nBUS_19]|uniref:hypothetical protein n=1 Tax=Pseudopelagicola sp. nBUS_19 TaxID=3395316 RepID=UPI003EBEB51E